MIKIFTKMRRARLSSGSRRDEEGVLTRYIGTRAFNFISRHLSKMRRSNRLKARASERAGFTPYLFFPPLHLFFFGYIPWQLPYLLLFLLREWMVNHFKTQLLETYFFFLIKTENEVRLGWEGSQNNYCSIVYNLSFPSFRKLCPF